MSATKTMIQFRNDVAGVYLRSIKSAGRDGISTNRIVDIIKEELAGQIETLKSQLIESTLRSLVHNVGRRKNPATDDREASTLFDEYKRIPHSVTVEGTKKKPTENLTIEEAKLYLKDHRRKSVETLTEMQRLVNDLETFKKADSDTLGVLMQRRLLR